MNKKHTKKYLYLLISLLLLLLVYPFFDNTKFDQSLLLVLVLFVMLAAINAASYNRRKFIIACILGAPWLVVSVIGIFSDVIRVDFADVVFGGAFFAYVTAVMFIHIFTVDEVSSDILFGSACVYLMIGLTWSIFYEILNFFDPISIHIPSDLNVDGKTTWTDLLYYSFVTLTTLGYGDLAPVSKHARSLAIVETIVGQLYLTILVARLMGLHLSKSDKI